MLSSIRWRLQLWHAGILVLAVVGVGATSYFGIRRARYAEIDSQLTAAGEVLVTGAAGGVGSVAVAILAKHGFNVVAATGRPQEGDYLKALGAAACKELHADGNIAYLNKIKFWKTPLSNCGNGKSDCASYSQWVAKWTSIKG